jgi:hypothetical protein
MIPTPLAPYVVWLKVGALALVIGLAMAGGCSVQKARDADQRHALEMTIAGKDQAIAAAATALRGSGAAIREINAEAAREVAAADAESKAFADAANVATTARVAAEKRAAALDDQFTRAQRAKPACDDLARTVVDMEGVCGISVR